MGKLIFSLFVILVFSSCKERLSPKLAIQTLQESPKTSNSEPLFEDIPVIPEPILIEETRPLPSSSATKQTFRGGVRSDGLDIRTIRSSHSDKGARLVFDSYTSSGKAEQSGKYTFTYNPSKNQITAVVYGYRKFTALSTKKNRTFPNNSLINNITMEKMMDDSAFKFNISLKDAASVNVFELKSPARIVVDITQN